MAKSTFNTDKLGHITMNSSCTPDSSGIAAFFSSFTRSFARATAFVAATFCIPHSHADTPPPNLQFEHLLTEHGIAISAINAITQDRQGYMWFGGLDGLAQYDGYNFTLYRNKTNDPDSISSNVIWDVLEDKTGQLWIATDDGLSKFNRDSGTFTKANRNALASGSGCNEFARSIAEDGEGNLWVATFTGLLRISEDRTAFECYKSDPKNETTIAINELRKVYVDHADTIWIGTNHAGLNRFDKKSGQVRRYPFDDSGQKADTSQRSILAIFEDKDGYLWLGSEGGGLSRLNPQREHFQHFRHSPKAPNGLSHNSVMDIAEDRDGNLWLATEGGLNYLDRATLSFMHYVYNPAQKSSLNTNVLHKLYRDDNGDLWIGNLPSGVNFLDMSSRVFRTWRHDPTNPNGLNHNSVFAMHEDDKGNFWLGTDGGGLNYLDMQTDRFTHYQHDPANPNSISATAVLSIAPDKSGDLWLGTWRGGANKFDPKTGKSKIYLPKAGDANSISHENVWHVFSDHDDGVWFTTIGGGIDKYDEATDGFKHYLVKRPGWTLYQDRRGQIWAGTGEGLGRFNSAKNEFEFFRHNPKDPDSLSFDVVFGIAEDSRQRLWVATRGGGLNMLDEKTGKFIHVREQDGLLSDGISSLKADDLGNLWIGSNNGITRFDPITRATTHYDATNGLAGSEINIGAIYKTRAGKIMVGSTEGLTMFDPRQLTLNSYQPKVAIVDFQIFNKPVRVGATDSPLQKVISQTQSITLDYHQSVFSFSFAAMSYRHPQKNRFAYMLEGFEKEWNYVGSERRNATYTNLNSGTYTFRVKASNNQGVWSANETRITLHILPPPWATWWAFTLYGLVVIAALAALIRFQHNKIINERKTSRYLETKVEERTAELQIKHSQLEEAYTQLEALSLSDPLTGLNNRRYLQNIIAKDVAKVKRHHSYNNYAEVQPPHDFTFFLLDIDFFKSVNDTYGHLAGDQLLIQVSNLLKEICRDSDCLVRWGGEEFLLVSRFCSRTEAPATAARIRKAMENRPFKISGEVEISKTCSIGYATYPFVMEAPEEISWENVVGIADLALYAAKKSGRNCSLGIASNKNTPRHNIYKMISSDLAGMLERKEIRMIKEDSN